VVALRERLSQFSLPAYFIAMVLSLLVLLLPLGETELLEAFRNIPF